MGIYIKDAELPTSCRSCPFENGGDCYGGKAKYIMDVDDNEEQFRNSRHPNCPLIEVPEPHGRLIDADALADDLETDGKEFGDEMKLNCASWLRSNATLTVIERSDYE